MNLGSRRGEKNLQNEQNNIEKFWRFSKTYFVVNLSVEVLCFHPSPMTVC